MALRYSSKGQSRHSQNILDRPIARPDKPYGETGTVSLSAFAYLFSEIISYHNSNIIKKNHTADDFNRRLVDLGFDVGTRLLELMTLRGLAQKYKRPTRLQDMLFFIVKDVWKCLFGEKVAVPDLNRANDDEYRYWIEDRSPSYIKYITVPKDYRGFHPASFIAGIVKGILDASGFEAE